MSLEVGEVRVVLEWASEADVYFYKHLGRTVMIEGVLSGYSIERPLPVYRSWLRRLLGIQAARPAMDLIVQKLEISDCHFDAAV